MLLQQRSQPLADAAAEHQPAACRLPCLRRRRAAMCSLLEAPQPAALVLLALALHQLALPPPASRALRLPAPSLSPVLKALRWKPPPPPGLPRA